MESDFAAASVSTSSYGEEQEEELEEVNTPTELSTNSEMVSSRDPVSHQVVH